MSARGARNSPEASAPGSANVRNPSLGRLCSWGLPCPGCLPRNVLPPEPGWASSPAGQRDSWGSLCRPALQPDVPARYPGDDRWGLASRARWARG